MRTYLSNRLAICPKRRQLGCRATAQSHCRLCKPHRRASFDHLVGAGEHRQRNAEAECLCSLQVDDQFDLDRLLDRHLRRLFALEDSACINSSLAVTLSEARSIAHQPAGCRELPESEDRGKRMLGRKYDKLLFSCIEERVASHDDGPCSPLHQVCEGGVDFAWTTRLKDFD